MKVWTVMKGELSEGGGILGIYADRKSALQGFIEQAQVIRNSVRGVRLEEDGSVIVEFDGYKQVIQPEDDGSMEMILGCNWLDMVQHDVQEKQS